VELVENQVRMISSNGLVFCRFLLFFLFVGCACATPLKLDCGTSILTVDDRGLVVSLQTGQGREILLKNTASPLLRLKAFAGEVLENPKGMNWKKVNGVVWLTLDFRNSTAVIKVEEKTDFLKMEVTELKGEEVELVFWGPYHCIIRETLAESLGAIYDDKDAIGLMALNIKTSGGYKTPNDSYRGTVAVPVSGGSKLQAHARNRTRPGVFTYGGQKQIHVLPIRGETAIGTKVALYSTDSKNLLKTVGSIETMEGLPHPEYKGKWLKTSSYATSSKLITNFKENTFDEYLELAKAAGILCIYNPNIFRSWGTYEVDPAKFPNGMEGLKRCVIKAKKHGITLGTHTLTNFIHSNDPLITPIPHPGLIRAGATFLKSDLDSQVTEIILEDDTLIDAYDRTGRGHAHVVQVDNELIEFSARSDRRPWKLSGCKRGAFGTKAVAHKVNAKVAKLVSQGYGVFLPTIPLQDEMAARMARFFNESGFKRLSFDGLEGCLRTGHGRYAEERFFKVFFDHLEDRNIIVNSSQLPHFAWHYTSNESWGEPWIGGFRESMLEHRLEAQKFLARNKLPSKLGQFRIGNSTTVEDIDWVMGICAGLDSGVDFYIEPSIFSRNPQGRELVSAINRWETARLAEVFTETEKKGLRNPNTIYTLVSDGNSVKLQFVKDWVKESQDRSERKMTLMNGVFGDSIGSELSDDYIHVNKPREPGQPTHANWSVDNMGKSQSMQFVMRSPKENTQVIRGAYFKVGAFTCRVPFELKAGDSVVAKGVGRVALYSSAGKLLASKSVDDLELSSGANEVEFNNQREGDDPGPSVVINFRTHYEGYSLTTGKPVTSSNNRNESSLVNDGRMKHSKYHWSGSSGNKPWWQVDLKKPTLIRRIVVVPYHNGPRYYQFTVQTSLNGSEWTTVVDRSANTDLVPKSGYDFELKAREVRYIRVNMLKHSLNGAVHLVEVMAF
jgi:hypothetical protein